MPSMPSSTQNTNFQMPSMPNLTQNFQSTTISKPVILASTTQIPSITSFNKTPVITIPSVVKSMVTTQNQNFLMPIIPFFPQIQSTQRTSAPITQTRPMIIAPKTTNIVSKIEEAKPLIKQIEIANIRVTPLVAKVEIEKVKTSKVMPNLIIPSIVEKTDIIDEFYNPNELLNKVKINKAYSSLPIIKQDNIVLNKKGKVYHRFTDKDTYVRENDKKEDYHSRKMDSKNTFGWGQRKLGLALIQFLTLYLENAIKNPQVVYAGAATGENIDFVSNLFPHVTFHLYDPRSFNIKLSSRVLLYNGNVNEILATHRIVLYSGNTYGWFTDETAKYWGDKQIKDNNVFFLSDIRSGNHVTQTMLEFEQSVITDMKNQSNWHKIIKPIKSQLKFRLPYNLDEVDTLLGTTDKKYVYLTGSIYKGIYAKPTSTETRLVPDGYDDYLHDFKEYESKLFYFNSVVREKHLFINPLYSNNQQNEDKLFEPIYPPELLNDYNSTAEAYIWIQYLKKFKKEPNEKIIKSLVDAMNKALSIKMNKTLNGLRQLA